MARRAAQHATKDRWLPAAVAVLFVLSFLPARVLTPFTWLGDLVAVLVAPVSQPVRIVGAWLSPASAAAPEPEEIALLRRQRDEYQTLYERMRERNNDLLRQMEQLRLMIELNPAVNTRHLNAPVISGTSDPANALLLIRAGTANGVNRNDVVAVEGVQLFGRVERAAARTSWILPITAEASGYIEGQVMVADGDGFACKLRPVGDGTLMGDVGDPGAQGSTAIQPGQVVRLLDRTWHESAQMLVIGRVESVAPAPDSPLRPVIVVRPSVALERVTEVIVRITPEEREAGGEGGP
jgi:cell shape-determining protein MreC